MPLPSQRLGSIVDCDGERLRLRDSATGDTILTEQEAVIARLKAENAALKKK